ncbi:MAG: ATP-dependent RecD-like DNA helicase [bacterium ADurb.Bin212]|nr:MAG: ATP-dependent RecD-like DNA helicase [bacterium ADurb.Bin212]
MTQDQALKILKSGANVFLTGEPGSGKTYTINRYVEYLRSHAIEPAITASTGIAATHIGGMTIHSWSGIGIRDRLSRGDIRSILDKKNVLKRIQKAKVLIIDEISMLDANTLDNINAICCHAKANNNAFGGLQVVLVGDFLQLPPVVKRTVSNESQGSFFDETEPIFAYQSSVWREADLSVCYITEQFRQKQGELLQILSKIRSNSFDESSLNMILSRRTDADSLSEDIPKLYSHNIDVDSVNNRMLKQIAGEERVFEMRSKGPRNLIVSMKKGCLSPEKLCLKIGATVMFTKNDIKGKYVNGTLGEVFAFEGESGLPVVRTKSGQKIIADYADWSVMEDGKIVGSLTQIPLRLAWALTVHKSQGVSLDKAVMDLSRVFEFGQGYVALSRVRSLQGLYLLGFNDMAFKVDEEVLKQDWEFLSASAQIEMFVKNLSLEKQKDMEHEFLLRCGGSVSKKDVVKIITEPKDTLQETLKLWEQGKDPIQIAKERSLTTTTIFGHLEKLLGQKKINTSELSRIVPKKLKNEISTIERAFKKLDTNKLTPVFEYFKGKYSYEELRIVKMLL